MAIYKRSDLTWSRFYILFSQPIFDCRLEMPFLGNSYANKRDFEQASGVFGAYTLMPIMLFCYL